MCIRDRHQHDRCADQDAGILLDKHPQELLSLRAQLGPEQRNVVIEAVERQIHPALVGHRHLGKGIFHRVKNRQGEKQEKSDHPRQQKDECVDLPHGLKVQTGASRAKSIYRLFSVPHTHDSPFRTLGVGCLKRGSSRFLRFTAWPPRGGSHTRTAPLPSICLLYTSRCV